MNWSRYWHDIEGRCGKNEHLKQVGKTVGGIPVDEHQIDLIVKGVLKRLNPQPNHTLLDLCCGNGLITKRLAPHFRHIDAVDYCDPLLGVARRDHAADNITYYHAYVRSPWLWSCLGGKGLEPQPRYDRVLMYEAMQYLGKRDLDQVLKNVLAMTKPLPRLLFASIPDRERRWKFYDTWPRRLDWLKRTIMGDEAIGHWWAYEEVKRVVQRKHGRFIMRVNQHPDLYTAHYRFDVEIR